MIIHCSPDIRSNLILSIYIVYIQVCYYEIFEFQDYNYKKHDPCYNNYNDDNNNN